MEWTPDGETLLAGGQDADVLFINPETWEVEARVETDRGRAISDIDISRDLTGALASTESGLIYRVDLESLEVVGEPLAGAVSQFQNLAESPDGTLIAASGRDGALRIWDVATGRLIAEKLEGAQVFDLTFIDNDTLLTYGGPAPLVWDLSTDRLISTACDLAGRTFTDAERESFSDDLGGADVCQ